jgi:ribonuclease E
VREKVSFNTEPPLASFTGDAPASAPEQATTQAASVAPEPVEPAAQEPAASDSAADSLPRRAGWWSRRFGGGQ